MIFDGSQAQLCRLVRTGTEGHVRLDPDQQLAVDHINIRPRRRDHEAADLRRLPMLFPLRQPIRILDRLSFDVADVLVRKSVTFQRVVKLILKLFLVGRFSEITDDGGRFAAFLAQVIYLGAQ